MHSNETCYMCDLPATGREHVPPKCFFPKPSDTPNGSDLRQNLITVPSCDFHNSAKSKDDEYLCFVVAFHVQNNPIGACSSAQRFLRALEKRPSMINIFKDPFPVRVNGLPTIGFLADAGRVDRIFDHISRGIFFHHYGKKFSGSAIFSYPENFYLFKDSNRPDLEGIFTRHYGISVESIVSSDRYGENQSAFYYQVAGQAEMGVVLIRLVFFNGFIVDALLTESPLQQGNDA